MIICILVTFQLSTNSKALTETDRQTERQTVWPTSKRFQIPRSVLHCCHILTYSYIHTYASMRICGCITNSSELYIITHNHIKFNNWISLQVAWKSAYSTVHVSICACMGISIYSIAHALIHPILYFTKWSVWLCDNVDVWTYVAHCLYSFGAVVNGILKFI